MSDQPNDSAGSRGLLPSPALRSLASSWVCAPLRHETSEAEGALSGGDGVRVNAPGDTDAEHGRRLAQVVVHLGE